MRYEVDLFRFWTFPKNVYAYSLGFWVISVRRCTCEWESSYIHTSISRFQEWIRSKTHLIWKSDEFLIESILGTEGAAWNNVKSWSFSHLCISTNKLGTSENSTDLSSGAAPRSKSVEFSIFGDNNQYGWSTRYWGRPLATCFALVVTFLGNFTLLHVDRPSNYWTNVWNISKGCMDPWDHPDEGAVGARRNSPFTNRRPSRHRK